MLLKRQCIFNEQFSVHTSKQTSLAIIRCAMWAADQWFDRNKSLFKHYDFKGTLWTSQNKSSLKYTIKFTILVHIFAFLFTYLLNLTFVVFFGLHSKRLWLNQIFLVLAAKWIGHKEERGLCSEGMCIFSKRKMKSSKL